MYRKEVAAGNKREFLRLGKGEKGQIADEKKDLENPSTTVCF